MSDPRNVAHDKKVTQEKKHHQGSDGKAGNKSATQPGKKTAAAKTPGGAAAAEPAEPAPAEAAAAVIESPTLTPPATMAGSMAVLAKLKEMEFYSRANLAQLAGLVLTVGDELKQKDAVQPLDEVYSAQNALQTKLTALIETYQAEYGRLQGETA